MKMYGKTVFWIVLVCGSFYVPIQSFDQLLHVYIDAKNGTDSLECLRSNSKLKACETLSFVAENSNQTKWVVIEITSDSLNLTQPVEFNSWTHLTINGSGTLIHCNESDAGIAFVRVRNLTIHSLTMDQCGTERNSTSIADLYTDNKTECLNVTIYILNCTDVTMSHVDIQYSHGRGLSMYDTNGTVDITHCNFSNNTVNDAEEGGGGVHIEFATCSPGIVGNCSGHNGKNRDSKYSIRNCTFTHNRATRMCSCECAQVIIFQRNSTRVPRMGKGGGLYIHIGFNATGNNFLITDCRFIDNTALLTGGGMLVEFLNSASKNTVSIYSTEFINNTCSARDVGTGGGLSVLIMLYDNSQVPGIKPIGNFVLCKKCTFGYNDAHSGGGTTIIATKQWSSANQSNVSFIQCNWTSNTGPVGAAVYTSPALWDFTVQGFLLVPLFQDCTFVYNSAYQPLQTQQGSEPLQESTSNESSQARKFIVKSVGFGVLFVSKLHITFKGNTNFTENIGSAVCLSDSVMEFSEGSNVTFYRNKGQNGGALAMYGSSVIRISNDSTFTFRNNKAYSRGGAIYTEIITSLQAYHNCFIESSTPQTNAVLIFSGNVAKLYSSSSIFSNSLRACRLSCFQAGQNVSIMEPVTILKCIANVSVDDNKTIATPPKNFTLNETLPVKLAPGIEQFVNITAIDEMGKSLNGIVYGALIEETNISTISQVSNNTVKVYGNVCNTTTTLYLETRDITLSFDITLFDCPIGYVLFNQSCECAASYPSSQYLGLTGCTADNRVSMKQGFWMGFCSDNTTKLCTTYCPYGFCKMKPNEKLYRLPKDPWSLDMHMCGPDRTGTVCSMCRDNHSVYFHSFKYTCGSESLCSVGWLFYIFSEIFPLIFLFAVILIFNISFTNGNANGFILFAQILDALATNLNGTVEYPSPINVPRAILTVLYRHLNLNFFTAEKLSFCLWRGATVIDMFIMKYVTVGLALALVLMTILFARCRCMWLKKRFRTPKSVLIHGLSAFFVLCYSQCARVTFHILDFFCLYSAGLHCERKVVNRVGHLTYFHGDHIPYALVAIVVLIFMVILPPLLLLVYPLVFKLLGLCKLSESKLAGILWRVMPIQLLDAFQSSFKDEFRFFAGLYFLYRAIVLAVFSYTQELMTFYIFLQVHLTAMLALHAIFQPYKKRKHNILDALLFTNLTLINGISLYNYSENDNILGKFNDVVNIMAAIQVVLIFLPMLYPMKLCVEKSTMKYREWKKSGDGLPPLRGDESLEVSVNKMSYQSLIS